MLDEAWDNYVRQRQYYGERILNDEGEGLEIATTFEPLDAAVRRVAAAAVAELAEALPTVHWFAWAVQNYKKAPDSLTMMMPCTMGDIRTIWAALKGGDADAVFTAPSK